MQTSSSDTPPTGELAAGTTLCSGRYHIDRFLASGGAATVYAAAMLPHGQQVALKILKVDRVQKRRFVERLKNEMRIGTGLQTVPNLVRPLDYGEIPELGGRPYIAFELEDAPDLGSLPKPLDPMLACRIARILADTLASLHALGVVHRDVKPTNVIVDHRNALRVRLIDLGYATSIGCGMLPDTRGLTQEVEMTGTLEYMAPEHVLGMPAAPSFDIYGLASTLWEMVLGTNPHSGRRQADIVRLQCDTATPSPSASGNPLALGIDEELAALIDRGMKKDRSERVGSAVEFRDALDRILDRLETANATGGTQRILSTVEPTPAGRGPAEGSESSAAALSSKPAEMRTEPDPESASLVIDAEKADSEVRELASTASTGEGVEEDAPLRGVMGSGGGVTQRVEAEAPLAATSMRGGTVPSRLDTVATPAAPVRPGPAAAEGDAWDSKKILYSVVTLAAVALLGLGAWSRAPANPEVNAVQEQTTAKNAAVAVRPPTVEDAPVASAQETGVRTANVEYAAAAPRVTVPPPKFLEDDPPPVPPHKLEMPPPSTTMEAKKPVPTTNSGTPPVRKKTKSPQRTKKAPSVPSTPSLPAHMTTECKQQRKRAQQVSREESWLGVLQETKRAECWSSQTSRKLLRLNALLDLGRYEQCIAEGSSDPNPQIQARVASCRSYSQP